MRSDNRIPEPSSRNQHVINDAIMLQNDDISRIINLFLLFSFYRITNLHISDKYE